VPEIGIYIAIGTFCLAILGYAVTLTWALSRIEKEQQEYTDAQIDNLQRDMANLERETINKVETFRHDAGEMGAAIRQKMHEMETWNRDTFVRKDSFELVINRIEKSMEKLGDRVEEKLEKLWEKAQRS
jgi:hypothetical protein